MEHSKKYETITKYKLYDIIFDLENELQNEADNIENERDAEIIINAVELFICKLKDKIEE